MIPVEAKQLNQY